MYETNTELKKLLRKIKKSLLNDQTLSKTDVHKYMHQVESEFKRSPGFKILDFEHAYICARNIIQMEVQCA